MRTASRTDVLARHTPTRPEDANTRLVSICALTRCTRPISYWPLSSPCSRKGLWCRSIYVIPRTPWSSRGQLCALNPRGGTWSCQRPRSAMSKGMPHLCPLYSRLRLPLGLPVPREHVERCSNPIKQVCFHRGARTSLLLSGTSRRSPYQFRGTGTSAPFSQIRCIYRPDAIEIRMLNGARRS